MDKITCVVCNTLPSDLTHLYCAKCGTKYDHTPSSLGESLQSPLHNFKLPKYLLSEGVTEEDESWWNSQSQNERDECEKQQQASTIAILEIYTKEGLTPTECVAKLWRTQVQYSYFPLDEDMNENWGKLGYTEEDYPLPWQLSKRCTDFIFRCHILGMGERFREIVEQFSSANASFREQIRQGAI